MIRRSARPGDPLSRRLEEALAAARWEIAELLSRRSPALAADLAEGRAAELALSPLIADQLLSLALELGADDLRSRRSVLAEEVLARVRLGEASDAAREAVRAIVAVEAPQSVDGAAVVRDEEKRLRSRNVEAEGVAADLSETAMLYERLWDDPRLPAPPAVRAQMAAAAPGLRRRSETQKARSRKTDPFAPVKDLLSRL